jgi:hypothetical protein
MILTFLLIIQPLPFSFWVPYVHRPCTHNFRWGHKARYVQIYLPHTMAPYLPPSFHPLCSRTSSDVIPTIHHIYTCLTDVFTSINGLDTSCPSPIFPLPPITFFQFHRPHGGRPCIYTPFLMYVPSSMLQWSSFDCLFMSHQAILIVLDYIQRYLCTTCPKSPQSKIRVYIASIYL